MKKLIVLGIIFISAALTWLYPEAMISPGKLVKGHEDLNDKCVSCHQPFGGISNDNCISCHELSDIGKDSLPVKDSSQNNMKLLFHEGLAGQKCTSCHTDHKGVIPGKPISNFKHELLAANVTGNCNSCHNKPVDKIHVPLSANCGSCHNTAGWKLSVTFNHAMIQGIDKTNCVSCHQKPNDSFHKFSAGDCSTCHTTTKWVPSTFDHSTYFLLDKNHNPTCNTCHNKNNFVSYTCYGCHEHSENKIINKHTEEGIYQISNCVSCHRSGNEHDIRMNGDYNKKSDEKGINNIKQYMNSEKKKDKKDND